MGSSPPDYCCSLHTLEKGTGSNLSHSFPDRYNLALTQLHHVVRRLGFLRNRSCCHNLLRIRPKEMPPRANLRLLLSTNPSRISPRNNPSQNFQRRHTQARPLCHPVRNIGAIPHIRCRYHNLLHNRAKESQNPTSRCFPPTPGRDNDSNLPPTLLRRCIPAPPQLQCAVCKSEYPGNRNYCRNHLRRDPGGSSLQETHCRRGGRGGRCRSLTHSNLSQRHPSLYNQGPILCQFFGSKEVRPDSLHRYRNLPGIQPMGMLQPDYHCYQQLQVPWKWEQTKVWKSEPSKAGHLD